MRLVLAAALLALLAACAERPEDPPAPPAARRERPLAQDGTTARAITSTPDRARVQLDLAAARAALRTYHAERGAWPRSLDELSLAGLAYPADLAYDPATGSVTSATYPAY